MSKTKKDDVPSNVLSAMRRQKHRHIVLTLNSSVHTSLCAPHELLSDFLRYELGATGTHTDYEHGVCGACTVRVDDVASRSCLMLAVQADDCAVDTVEGLATHEGLSDLQEAFRRYHALQCGSHTTGILMSCTDYLECVSESTKAQIREMLSGHLYRCTSYTPVIAAVLDIVASRAGARPVSAPVPGETSNA